MSRSPLSIALSVPFVATATLVGCAPVQQNMISEQATEPAKPVTEIPVGGDNLGLTSVNMNATLFHEFDFALKKILSLRVNSQIGLGARVVTGMETDNICPRPGVLDAQGKVYTLYFGRFVDQGTGQAIPFNTDVEIVQNLTASGVHAGQLAVNYVNGRYDKYGQAVVDVQICAKNTGRQSYVREFKVTLTPQSAPVPPASNDEIREDPRVFDVNYYLNRYPDLRAAFGTDTVKARQHWVLHGTRECRIGNPSFIPRAYLALYPDLRNAFGPDNCPAAIEHYMRFGIKEGRNAQSVLTNEAVFGAAYYLEHYPDLKAAFGTDTVAATEHWLVWGIKEGRRGVASFSPQAYLNKYADLKKAFGPNNYQAATEHYVNFGIREGRSAP